MMVWPLLVTSRMISASVGGWSSVLVWDSVANMCSNITREGGWGQRGDGGDGDGVPGVGGARPPAVLKPGDEHEALAVTGTPPGEKEDIEIGEIGGRISPPQLAVP